MEDAKRLELIAEAVRYCQRVRAMGMPPSCYSKALREPIYFLWERREEKNKEHIAKFRSKNTIGLRYGGGAVVYDHSVPFRYLQEELLKLSDVTSDSIDDILNKYGIAVLITKEEDGRLNKAGYRSRMPDDWNGSDPFARYKAVGIELIENIGTFQSYRK